VSDHAHEETFFVSSPTGVGELLRSWPKAEGHILLKPVARSVLRAFLESAMPFQARSLVATLKESRDELLQRLLQANLKLQEYDQQRNNFISRAIHDFRAPLTSLGGWCGLLSSGQLGPLNDNQKEVLLGMDSSVRRLSRMASSMFELGIGQKVERTPDLRNGDITASIRQALHEIQTLVTKKEISVQTEKIAPPNGPLWFDASQMEQVFVNLLDNASKFTRRGGVIEVKGQAYFWERRLMAGAGASRERRVRQNPAPNSYRIDIRDTGPGIPPELVSHIFEEYTSYSGSHDRSGAGLGLAISRLIVERHGGHIWTEALRDGALFSVVLPYRNDPGRALPIDELVAHTNQK
jgi:signal transduction histidine kinase